VGLLHGLRNRNRDRSQENVGSIDLIDRFSPGHQRGLEGDIAGRRRRITAKAVMMQRAKLLSTSREIRILEFNSKCAAPFVP
jgi:hypothetical protein